MVQEVVTTVTTTETGTTEMPKKASPGPSVVLGF